MICLLDPRCFNLFISQLIVLKTMGIDLPPCSIDPSRGGYFWSGLDWTTVVYSTENMLLLVLCGSHIQCIPAHKTNCALCNAKTVIIIRQIPRKDIYDVHTNSYQTNRVTHPLDIACPAETNAPRRMGFTKTPLLGLADFTPCRSYSISGSRVLYPGHSRLLLLLQPKTNNESDSGQCMHATGIWDQYPRKVSSPGIWLTAATKPVAGSTSISTPYSRAMSSDGKYRSRCRWSKSSSHTSGSGLSPNQINERSLSELHSTSSLHCYIQTPLEQLSWFSGFRSGPLHCRSMCHGIQYKSSTAVHPHVQP